MEILEVKEGKNAKIKGKHETKNVQLRFPSRGNQKFVLLIGEHINGGFAAVLNKKVSCEISTFDDRFYNRERLSRIINNKKDVDMLVKVIAQNHEHDFHELKAKEISVDYNGCNFLIIFGKIDDDYDSTFCIIPNWQISCFLKKLDNVAKNAKILEEILENEESAYGIAYVLSKEN